MMKTHLSALMIMCAVASLVLMHCHQAEAQSQAFITVKNLSFEKTVHDFGAIADGSGPKTCTFKYKNNTDIAIVIQKVIVSCSCTSVEWSDKPVKPGGTGEVKVVFSNRLGPGKFDKSISVTTSSTPVQILLHVKGDVTKKAAQKK